MDLLGLCTRQFVLARLMGTFGSAEWPVAAARAVSSYSFGPCTVDNPAVPMQMKKMLLIAVAAHLLAFVAGNDC